MATIEAEGLTKRFGGQVAVDSLSFTVEPGRVVGFLGPNGAGKTTTLRMILGLVRPTAGQATIDGRPYRELSDPAGTVGAVLENSRFHPGRSGRDHLRVLAAAAGLPRSRAEEVLALVELGPAGDKRAGAYSLGMRQRLGIAAALLGDPPVLILDEPANGLDPQGIRALRDLVRARAAGGSAVLISSHVLAEVAQTVDEVIVLDRGRMLAQAPLDELTGRAGAGVRLRSPRAAELAELLSPEATSVEWAEPDVLVLGGVTGERVGDLAAARGLPIYELASRAASLEDVFLKLTGRPAAPGEGPGAVQPPSPPADGIA